MVAELVQDLVHLERSEDRLDENGRLDRPLWDPEPVLREDEGVVPEPRLEVALELREIEVRAGPALEQPLRVSREKDAEVEEACETRPAVDLDVPLEEMPAARANEEDRDLVLQRVALLGGLDRDRPLDRVGEVLLAADDVRPGRGVRVLEVGHVRPRARVERVDDHLPVARRPGDLDAAVLEIGRDGRDAPVPSRTPRVSSRNPGSSPASIRSCALDAREQQLLAPPAELALERGDQLERFRREHPGGVGSVESDSRRYGWGAHAVLVVSNCASSVEPLSASVELSPPLIASSTASK